MTVVPPATAATPLSRLVAADDAFGGDLYAVAAPDTGNVALSPLSVAAALQLTLQGARGATAEQLRRALHLPDDAVAAAGMRQLAESVEALRHGEHALLRIENTVWVQAGLPLQEPFSRTLTDDYLAALHRADFRADPDAARQAINHLIAEQTNDKIRDLLARDQVDTDTRLVLANAVYLRAQWVHQFGRAATRPEPFRRADGSRVEVPTMHETATLGYGRRDGYQVVTLPYVGGRLAMAVLLPDGPVEALERRVAQGGLAPLPRPVAPTRVALALPRFELSSRLDLVAPLRRLGVVDAFTRYADFSGITDAAPLQVSSVVHQAYVRVDEEGTEAAAATATGMRVASLVVSRPVEVRVDRPFLFAITDTEIGAPLFLGRVSDPTERS